MKKVLIIAHDFLPLASVGALRPFSWFNHFNESNVYSIVVTRYWNEKCSTLEEFIAPSDINKTKITKGENNLLIQVPYTPNLRDRLILKYGLNKFKFIRKALSFLEVHLKYPINFFDNTYNIYKGADEFLKNEKVDYIIATGEPWVDFKYASKLSYKYNIPWIADYRDGWTTNVHHENAKGIKKALNENWFRRFERKYISNSAFINVTDQCEIGKIQKLHPSKKITNIQNGYDQTLIEPYLNNTYQNSEKFSISYAGTIYPFQDLESFLEAVVLFQKETEAKDFEINFIGAQYYQEQVERIEGYNKSLLPYINCTKRISQKEVIIKLLQSHAVLILCHSKRIALPSKIFEYFSLNRKIIVSTNDNNIVRDLMEECNGGYNCNNINEIKNALIQMYFEFKKTGKVEHQCIDYHKYSRKNQAKLFCKTMFPNSI
jgi:glycosyltransferase involved in cell wall biosynthesis